MSYAYRDPARVTPARLAQLAEWDRRHELLQRGRQDLTLSPRQQEAARQARIRQFTRLRAQGYSVPRAADAMGIARSTGRHYEAARKQLTSGGTA